MTGRSGRRPRETQSAAAFAARSDASRFDPLIDVAPGPSAVAIAQPDVVGAGGIDTSLALSRPVMQRRDGHTCHVVDFFGGKHLAVSVCGDRHVVSPKAWRDWGVLDVHSGTRRISQ